MFFPMLHIGCYNHRQRDNNVTYFKLHILWTLPSSSGLWVSGSWWSQEAAGKSQPVIRVKLCWIPRRAQGEIQMGLRHHRVILPSSTHMHTHRMWLSLLFFYWRQGAERDGHLFNSITCFQFKILFTSNIITELIIVCTNDFNPKDSNCVK